MNFIKIQLIEIFKDKIFQEQLLSSLNNFIIPLSILLIFNLSIFGEYYLFFNIYFAILGIQIHIISIPKYYDSNQSSVQFFIFLFISILITFFYIYSVSVFFEINLIFYQIFMITMSVSSLLCFDYLRRFLIMKKKINELFKFQLLRLLIFISSLAILIKGDTYHSIYIIIFISNLPLNLKLYKYIKIETKPESKDILKKFDKILLTDSLIIQFREIIINLIITNFLNLYFLGIFRANYLVINSFNILFQYLDNKLPFILKQSFSYHKQLNFFKLINHITPITTLSILIAISIYITKIYFNNQYINLDKINLIFVIFMALLIPMKVMINHLYYLRKNYVIMLYINMFYSISVIIFILVSLKFSIDLVFYSILVANLLSVIFLIYFKDSKIKIF